MFNAKMYLNKVAKTPKQAWRGLNQATIDTMWNDTDTIYTIYEQEGLPFTDTYNAMEVWVSSISENLIAPQKVYDDFLEILFRDCGRMPNYRGQYYRLQFDNELEETYICYESISPIAQTKTSKIVRCNNKLTFVNSYGKIVSYPCYLGVELSSTNDKIAKNDNVENGRLTIYVQANDDTNEIKINQRFIFGTKQKSAFKVETLNDVMTERGVGEPTMLRLYVARASILPTDDLVNNIADLGNSETVIVENENKHIVLTPNNVSDIFNGDDITFMAHVENEDVLTTDVVTCTCTGTTDGYTLFETIDDSTWKVSVLKYVKSTIALTFEADGCDPVTVELVVRR